MLSLDSRFCAVAAVVLAGIGVLFASAAPVEAGDKARCPSSYTLLGNYCFNYATADIVLPDDPRKPLTFADSDCPLGYRILVKSLCIYAPTGDIEIANVNPAGAPEHTAD